jgi:hypothetical protein
VISDWDAEWVFLFGFCEHSGARSVRHSEYHARRLSPTPGSQAEHAESSLAPSAHLYRGGVHALNRTDSREFADCRRRASAHLYRG